MIKTDYFVTWTEYLERFEDILNSTHHPEPYDKPAYLDYLKLNRSRQNRWLKTAQISDQLKDLIQKISTPQQWIIITEPWCGDAAHSIPFLFLMSEENPLITLQFVWRDQPPFLIEHYLTNGGKSVPKLIIRDKNNNDLATWGPRPIPCQAIYRELKENDAPFEEQKITLQNWYNTDKGKTIQKELIDLLSPLI